MFTANRLDWGDPAIGPSADAAHAVIEEISAPVAQRMELDTPEGTAVEQFVRSQIHGHTHLMIDGKLQRENGDGCEPFVAPLDLASVLLRE